jgi:hypothetical protein
MARDWIADLRASLEVCRGYDGTADEGAHTARRACFNDAARQAGACIASNIAQDAGDALQRAAGSDADRLEPLLHLKLAFDTEWDAQMATLLARADV